MEEKRVVLKRHGIVDPLSIDDYLSKGGYEGLKKVLSLSSDEVLSEVEQSGLRGRGGAFYPVALKWKVCSASDERKRYLVCNGVESDPHARGNKVLLTGDPHSVIEGMIIAAFAIGAHLSSGGRFISTLPSTAKNRAFSRIVPCHKKVLL